MATVTPNFNWPVPTSTDLVKDGATAIEALGDSIDGSLVDLKGGTTGQVLSKTSGTDMDFTWVTTDDANAIQNSIVNAKGDLIGASANDTPAILSVGNSGETIVADSSTSTGLRWNAGNYVNAVYNSSFDIWQRGTSFVPAAYNFGADRWSMDRAVTGSTISRQTAGLDGFRYCARVSRDSGNTATNGIAMLQTLETADAIEFAGKTATFSFYGRKGANYSDAGSDILINIPYGTGTDQPVQSFTGFAFAAQENKVLTTSWQRFTITFTVPSSATELAYYFAFTPVGTAGAADYFEVTGIQLELGSVATPYQRQNATIQGELAACQRYLPSIQVSSSDFAAGQCYATTATLISIPFPVTARVAPTGITVNAVGNFRVRNATSTLITCTGVGFSTASTQSASVDASVASGLVAGNATNLYNAGSGTILFTGCEL
jgi:hypothetical protein